MYKGTNKLRRNLNRIAAAGLILYAGGGSSNNSIKTGHPSADIATGRSQPTELEKMLIKSLTEFGNALIDANKIYSPMPLMK